MLDNLFPLYATVAVFSFLITVTAEKALIPSLKRKAKQPIYVDGPNWHVKKSGTPTLGGIGFLSAILIMTLLSIPLLKKSKGIDASLSLIITVLYAFLNALVGVIDDLKKLKKKENKGLTPIEKLVLQFLLAALFLYSRHVLIGDNTTLSFSYGEADIGFIYYPISLLILVGIINCANLTDGIDGLATSVAFSISVSLLYVSAALFEEVAIISSAVIGSSVGFLIFNLHPAKIFMGDTGSLFFGALIASSAVSLGNPLLALPVGGVYILEGASVIIQVICFKLTGKRVFKMAPLHHHLEKCGWSENRICIVSILMTFIFSIPAYIFYLP